MLESLANRLKDASRESSRNFWVVFSWKPRVFGEGNEMKEFAGRMLDALEEDLEQCIKEFRCDQKPPVIPAILIESKEEFEKIVSALGISPETSAIYISQYGIIMFRVEGFSINDLYHEMSHAVTDQKKRELGLRTDRHHWLIEEGLGVSREKREMGQRILQSLLSFYSREAGLEEALALPSEAILGMIDKPKLEKGQEQILSDLYAQGGSFITFLLSKGISKTELLMIAAEIVDAAPAQREQIIGRFLEKYKVSYEDWLRWQEVEARVMRKEWEEIRKKELDSLKAYWDEARRRGLLDNKRAREIIESEIRKSREAIERMNRIFLQ